MNVPQFIPYIGIEEYESIKSCFDNKWITEGPKSKEFVERICDIVGCKFGVLAPNGTLALYLGLVALGIKDGDEVIVPNFTFIASANSVEMAGATPVFVDVEKNTCQINIEDCYRVLTPKTKAIMPVHIFGMAANMDKVLLFAKENNLFVIEDAAQALGVEWGNKSCGNFGDIGCFSFFADKTITIGEGGFVSTNNEDLYNNLIYLRNQGRLNRGSFCHPQIGYNFRITDIQAAIGLSQLKKFEYICSRKLEIYNRYLSNLSKFDNIVVIPSQIKYKYIPFRTTVIFKDKKSNDIIEVFLNNNIEDRSFFYPLNRQPCYKKFQKDERYDDKYFSNSIYLYAHGICLPSFVGISDEQIDYVCDIIGKI